MATSKKSNYRQSDRDSKPALSDEVRRFLSRNGKKGGQRTRELIQAGKEAMDQQ